MIVDLQQSFGLAGAEADLARKAFQGDVVIMIEKGFLDGKIGQNRRIEAFSGTVCFRGQRIRISANEHDNDLL